jgi:glycolate oxidase
LTNTLREPELLAHLFDIVGPENVLTQSSKRFEDYRKDMGDFESNPKAVVQPANPDQVSSILRVLNEWKIPIVGRGGGTSLTGATSSRGGIVIDFSKHMNKILKIDTTNWYVHCEAGLVIDDLNEELAKYGFFFPPDPASTPWCTVGGVISENSGGMRTFRYGTVKNWVLALSVILADGSKLKLGEPLPKNRVGYDLVHLVCGSEGTLALITDAWLKIAPLPGAHGTQHVKKFMVFFSNWEDAVKSIIEIRAKGVQPNLLEFLSKEAMSAVNSAFDTKIPEHEAILFFEAPIDLLPEIIETCKAQHSIENYIGKDAKDEERLYSARALLLLGIKTLGSGVYNEDIVVPLDCLGKFLEYVRSVGSQYNLKIPTAGHAGDGNVHPTIVFDAESEDSRRRADQAFADIIYEAVRLGGSVSGEHGIGSQKIKFGNYQIQHNNGEKALDLMRSIKQLWDPNNILNPGKFIAEDPAN